MEKTIYSGEYQLLIEWLKRERKKQNLTMREVAACIDVSHTWVTKVEHRDRRLDVAEYVRYCRILKINPHEGIAILERGRDGERVSGKINLVRI